MRLACRRWRRRLPGFAGGDLDCVLADQLREHLRGCDGCRREASRLLQSTRALGAAVAQGPALGEEFFVALHRQVIDAVSVSAATGTGSRAALGRTSPWLRRSSLLAAAAALFLCGVLVRGFGSGAGLRGRAAILVQDVKAVPWSGERMPQFRLLGLEDADTPAECGSGMMGRLRLHTLEDLDQPERPAPLVPHATGRAR